MNDEIKKIKEYWDNRAKEHTVDLQGTTNDVYLRELEINTIVDKIRETDLKPGASIIDIGCGDGYSTMRLAKEFPEYHFVGVDYAENMIINANRRRDGDAFFKSRIEFRVVDILDLKKTLTGQTFDVAITMRVLINLPNFFLQQKAVADIANILDANGRYIAVENFIEGQQNMNTLRKKIGLVEIPVRWHNRFFEKAEFLNAVKGIFRKVNFFDFASSYYYVTRVIYSKMCQIDGVEPSYEHSLYQVALELPPQGEFCPIKLIVMDK